MILIFMFFTLFQTLHAEPIPSSRELFVAFYPPPFVEITLEKNGFPGDVRIAIIEDLMKRELDVLAEVHKRTDLEAPSSEKARIALYNEVVFEVFADTLRQHGMDDQSQTRALLGDIQQQKIDKMRAVLK